MSSRPVVKDKWKMKSWYEIIAPPVFGGISLGATPADDPDKLIGRVVETTLYDITGDILQVHIKLYFQVIEVKGNKAYTRFKGHELARDYIKSLIRRKSSKIQAIFDVTTKDGYVVRVEAFTLTSYRCKTSQEKTIRKIMIEHISQRAAELTLDEFINEILRGEISNAIAEKARKIHPVRRVEVFKTKLLAIPTPEGTKPAIVISPIQMKSEKR